ncbi:MAG: thioredoxin family protein [Bacteroidetes bacterium]|nr:thioredoxin family protein [Bacteroidota bacterium]
MKLGILSTILAIILSSAVHSQEMNQKQTDPTTGLEIFVGMCNREVFDMDEFGEIYRAGYDSYETKVEKLMELGPIIHEIKVIVIFGVWCEDSHLQVPRFMKIMDEIGADHMNFTFICVDKDKKAGDADMGDIVIEKVPIFIFKIDEEEIGRIIECPKKSLEEDIYVIINEYQNPKDSDGDESGSDKKKEKKKTDTKAKTKKKEDPKSVKLAPSNVKPKIK